MELEKIVIDGIENIYNLSVVRKELRKSVNEPWKATPPWKRYQKKLIEDLAVLSKYREQAIMFPQFEKLSGVDNLYSIRHPETLKNVRVLYTITDDSYVILLLVFLEKSSSDYQVAIKKAKERIQWLKDD